MMSMRHSILAAIALASACRASAPDAAPPAAKAGMPAPPPATRLPPPASPDVAFVTAMIAHHAQALEMTRLVPTREARAEVRLIAERIEASQEDEVGLMRRWLARRGQDTTAARQAHHADHSMPGMLTPDEMRRLAAASGPAFDRLFLELMIRHHEGALRMVADLLAAPRGADDPELFRLAADVDADQRAEIRRMRELLQR